VTRADGGKNDRDHIVCRRLRRDRSRSDMIKAARDHADEVSRRVPYGAHSGPMKDGRGLRSIRLAAAIT